MSLGEYRAKRHFSSTPEPKGITNRTKAHRLAFVVQEHHASQLHYDFRLELDGVLKSWAVPKGPSMDPADRHLAVRVEDHPYAYRTFEGVIPKGNYGGGKVIIWDEGYYEPRAEAKDAEAELRAGLRKGHLTFILHGKKLKGEFALIKMHGQVQDEHAWLLVKKDDTFASDADITKEDASVKSGKKVDEIGDPDFSLASLTQYPKRAGPWRVRPMLCTLIDEPFSKDGWLYEIKWDGYRAIASKKQARVELYSRSGNDFSDRYPSIVEAIHELPYDVILDGEIAVVDTQGKPHFERLQQWKENPEGTLMYYVFDILWCAGHDLRTMPLIERKAVLKAIISKNSSIRYSDHVVSEGTKLFKEMRRRGLEGIVAKRADSTYKEDYRGDDWLKIKTHLRQEVVIGGYTEPRGGRRYLGSLLVGVYKEGEFTYVGHSGGGIPDDQRKALREQLEKLERQTTPFSVPPKPNAPVHWVRPKLLCEMSFSEWTDDGRMRHPVFLGMRADKPPTSVHQERPTHITNHRHSKGDSTMAKQGAQISFTHLDKIFFPKHKYTKGDVVEHYRAVADYILPYLKDRPLSLLRQPDGITGESFFQKNMEHLPSFVPATDIYSDSHKATLHWMVGGTLDTLLYAVQLGSIEINPWNARVQHLDKPDWLVIDLDPEGIAFAQVVAVAQTVKKVCDEWRIAAYPKTSGKTGIHIFIPLHATYTHDQAKDLAHLLAIEINKREPERTSIERMPAKRPHKIYVDYLQNREGQTLAAPYSVRPTPDATVSTPLHWDEVTSKLRPTDFTIRNIETRLKRTGDLWQPVLGKGIDIARVLKAIDPQR